MAGCQRRALSKFQVLSDIFVKCCKAWPSRVAETVGHAYCILLYRYVIDGLYFSRNFSKQLYSVWSLHSVLMTRQRQLVVIAACEMPTDVRDNERSQLAR